MKKRKEEEREGAPRGRGDRGKRRRKRKEKRRREGEEEREGMDDEYLGGYAPMEGPVGGEGEFVEGEGAVMPAVNMMPLRGVRGGGGGEEAMNNRVGQLEAPLISSAMEEEIELNLVVPMMEVEFDDGEVDDIENEEKAERIEKVESPGSSNWVEFEEDDEHLAMEEMDTNI